LDLARSVAATWRDRALAATGPSAGERWLLRIPDVGPACEAILADRLFHDLRADERAGLLAWIRGSQDESGAWCNPDGDPDLSLTVLGWWARAQAGDDPRSDSMIRAVRIVHALGGAQRADFGVRLWLAMSGQIPWTYLPAIPGELFLLPPPAWLSPARFSPWARAILTPYYLIARAPARLQLTDASELLLQRTEDALVAPRLTRPGLAGDLLQAFDRTVKLSRKLPRGPLPRWATARAMQWLDASQQRHGGWFSVRPTLLSLIALRVMGAPCDDARIAAGLDYVRRARGQVRIAQGVGTGEVVLAQGLGGIPFSTIARLMQPGARASDIAWLLRQELSEPGPWQARADAPAGGWPLEPGAGHHLDLDATCAALDTLASLHPDSSQVAPAWATSRRAIDVVLAMQERHGGFSRFERGESDVLMRRLPWTDADLLAFGNGRDGAHVRLSAQALTHLGRTGFRLDDDRIGRGLRWLEQAVQDEHAHRSIATLVALAHCAAALCPSGHPLRREIERRIRGRQREDGSFGDIVETAGALRGLLAISAVCVQAGRAARWLTRRIAELGRDLEHEGAIASDGFGLSARCRDPSAGAREAALALEAYARTGSKLTDKGR
jgi:hypothetical protein